MAAESSLIRVDNPRDLQNELQGTDGAIAMVYVTWCFFCRKALPLFENAVRCASGTFLLVLDNEEQFADRYGIEIYPALLQFDQGQVTRRLEAAAGVGLTEKQIGDFIRLAALAPQT